MKKAFFIAGTDTEIGKTYCSVAVLEYFNQQNLRTAALKPIASDAKITNAGLRNDDALQLQKAQSMHFDYDDINPFTFEAPVSPHIAALPEVLSVNSTIERCNKVLESDYDILLVEGAGGWLSPLSLEESFADLAAGFGFPIILVVGLKLGCLNHTLLTWKNIQTRGLPFAGWVGNHIDPAMLNQTENINTLTHLLGTPPLALIQHGRKIEEWRDQVGLTQQAC